MTTAPLQLAPRITWATLHSRLSRDWEAGEHVTLVGPTGSGKTHLAIELLEMCRYRLVLATKRQDPLVRGLAAKGYKITGDLKDIQWDGLQREPIQKKVVFWPQFPEKMAVRDRLAAQASAIGKAIDWADKTGGWAVLVDETMWLHKNLRLEKELEQMWFQGRTQGLSVLANSQRPSHVPRLAWSMASYIFIWQTQDKRDLESLRDISSGFPKDLIDDSVRRLDWHAHEALFIDTRRREMATVIAPA